MIKPTLAILGALIITGCAAERDPNSFGAKLAQEGGEVAAIGQQWDAAQDSIAEGRDLIASGEKQIRKGEKQIESGRDNVDDGNAKIRKGERMIAEGERKAAQAEASYNARRAQTLPTLPSAN